MTPKPRTWLLLALAATTLGGCSEIAARDVDYSPQRAFSADIAASLDKGPTASHPGINGRNAPIGALPWEIGERHAEP